MRAILQSNCTISTPCLLFDPLRALTLPSNADLGLFKFVMPWSKQPGLGLLVGVRSSRRSSGMNATPPTSAAFRKYRASYHVGKYLLQTDVRNPSTRLGTSNPFLPLPRHAHGNRKAGLGFLGFEHLSSNLACSACHLWCGMFRNPKRP